jgi:23S rRNA (adenine2503-C2)-methyltransferase
MGEPLHNYRNTVQAAGELLSGGYVRKVALATSGVVPAIRKLTDSGLPIRLHISLHATTDEIRSSLVPINKRWPIPTLLAAASDYADARNERVAVNYMLLGGYNDSDDDISRLCALLDPSRFEVQLNRWNSIAGFPFSPASLSDVSRFAEALNANGLTASVHLSYGSDISAGCGQLVAMRKT